MLIRVEILNMLKFKPGIVEKINELVDMSNA